MTNTWAFLERALVIFQVSDPYIKTDLTLELKMRILVLRVRVLDLQMGLRMANACCAFLTLVGRSFSVPPVGLISLPR